MERQLDLRALERKAWRSMHQDGLWELTFSTFLFAGFLRDLTQKPLVGIAAMFCGIFVLVLGKWLITIPRMGLVRFGPERERRRHRLTLMIGVAVVLTFGLLYLAVGREAPWLREHHIWMSVGVALFLLAVFSLIAHQLDNERIYLVAVVFAANELASPWTDSPLLPLAGALVLAIPGFISLIRFKRRYPIPTEENGHVAG